jgi:hypothetical protein
VSLDLSTPGSVVRGATVLVASGIITLVTAGDFPVSSLAPGADAPQRTAPA